MRPLLVTGSPHLESPPTLVHTPDPVVVSVAAAVVPPAPLENATLGDVGVVSMDVVPVEAEVRNAAEVASVEAEVRNVAEVVPVEAEVRNVVEVVPVEAEVRDAMEAVPAVAAM